MNDVCHTTCRWQTLSLLYPRRWQEPRWQDSNKSQKKIWMLVSVKNGMWWRNLSSISLLLLCSTWLWKLQGYVKWLCEACKTTRHAKIRWWRCSDRYPSSPHQIHSVPHWQWAWCNHVGHSGKVPRRRLQRLRARSPTIWPAFCLSDWGKSCEVFAVLYMLLVIATWVLLYVAIASSICSAAYTSPLLPRSDIHHADQIVGPLSLNLCLRRSGIFHLGVPKLLLVARLYMHDTAIGCCVFPLCVQK